MPYIHDAIVRAWLDGKEIEEYEPLSDSWVKFTATAENSKVIPAFFAANKYRIKPQTVKLTYRAYLYKDVRSHVTAACICSAPEQEETIEKLKGFVRWVSDWIVEEFDIDEASSPKG